MGWCCRCPCNWLRKLSTIIDELFMTREREMEAICKFLTMQMRGSSNSTFFFRIYFTAVSSNQSKSNRRRQIVRGVAARWWNQQQQKEKVNNNNNNNNNRKKIFINFERVQSSIDIGALETAHVTQKLKRRCQLCWKSFFSRCFGAILHLLLPFFLHFFSSCNAALMNIDYRCPKNPRKESPRISWGVKSINIQMVHSGNLKRFQFIWENSIQFRE